MTSCATQLVYATVALPMGGIATRPVALDYGIVMTMGAARGADADLLARVLPGVEAAILAGDDGDLDGVGEAGED